MSGGKIGFFVLVVIAIAAVAYGALSPTLWTLS